MFTPGDRERIRAAVVDRARADQRISGGAMTGSASVGKEDEWSDIDLAFGVREGYTLDELLADFTELMYGEFGAVHHVDVPSGTWIYRVFFLGNTLQVDLAFAPAKDFGAKAETFRLLFGLSAELPKAYAPNVESIIGYAWLYALHVRSSIVRGKFWQAEYMLSGMRERVLAIACACHGLSTKEGRGFDQLPTDVLEPLRNSFVCSLDADALWPAFRCAMEGLLRETRLFDSVLASRLEPALEELSSWGTRETN